MYTVAQLAANLQYRQQSGVVWMDTDGHGKVGGCGVKNELCQAAVLLVLQQVIRWEMLS